VLNTLLVEHIRGLLPSLRGKIEVALAARRRELAMYGDSPPGSSSAARGGLLLTVLDSYANRFRCVFGFGCGCDAACLVERSESVSRKQPVYTGACSAKPASVSPSLLPALCDVSVRCWTGAANTCP
jgi:hypothetical protein